MSYQSRFDLDPQGRHDLAEAPNWQQAFLDLAEHFQNQHYCFRLSDSIASFIEAHLKLLPTQSID